MLGALIGPISNLVGVFLQGQLEKTKANNEVKVATAKAKAVVLQRQATGEIVPLILAFIPGMEDVVTNGFTQLNNMPDWYQYSLGVIVAASFGVRSATKLFRKK